MARGLVLTALCGWTLTSAGTAAEPRTASGLPAEGKLDAHLGKAAMELLQVFKGDRFPNVVVGVDGTVVATFGTSSVRARLSQDAGATWSEEITISKPGFQCGGLTVSANAPNPAGFGILKSSFGKEGISPLGLLKASSMPTVIAMCCLWFLGTPTAPAGGGSDQTLLIQVQTIDEFKINNKYYNFEKFKELLSHKIEEESAAFTNSENKQECIDKIKHMYLLNIVSFLTLGFAVGELRGVGYL